MNARNAIQIALLASQIAACGQVEFADINDLRKNPTTEYQVYSNGDPALIDLTNDFLSDCSYWGKGNECGEGFGSSDGIRFVAPETIPGAAGYCRRNPGNYGRKPYWTVEISEAYRDKPEGLRAVVYHELGHCVLGLGHSDGGIMNPVLAPDGYADAWDAEVANLFGDQ